jgi:WD40 repeat protein
VLYTLREHKGAIFDLAFSPDGTRLASCDGVWRVNRRRDFKTPGEVKVWDAQTGQAALTLHGHTHFVESVAFSPAHRQAKTVRKFRHPSNAAK